MKFDSGLPMFLERKNKEKRKKEKLICDLIDEKKTNEKGCESNSFIDV